jgi:hypothetical protein
MSQARRSSFVLPFLQHVSPERLQHALLMLATGSTKVTFTQFKPTAIAAVVTEQDDTKDRMFLSPQSFFCTCPEVRRRQMYCAHIALVALVALQQGSTESPPQAQAKRTPQEGTVKLRLTKCEITQHRVFKRNQDHNTLRCCQAVLH